MIIVGILVFLLIIGLIRCIVIVPQQHTYVIEFLGSYQTTWETGLHLKLPVLQKIARKISLKEQVLDFPPQPVITKDNVTMQIDDVIYYHVFDPEKFCYGVEHPLQAMETLAATTIRNIFGELELDETLTSREFINAKMQTELDSATDPWGIKVNRVELKNIMPPLDIQEAMEKQMRAERERREKILVAEGEKKSSVLKAEGEKEAAILQAEAKKVVLVREAEGHAENIRLHAEAEAAGVIKMQEAEANSIRMLQQAGLTTDQILQLRSLDAFRAAADGQATKIIIPSEIQSLAGLATGILESVGGSSVSKKPEPVKNEKCDVKPNTIASNSAQAITKSQIHD